MVKYADSPSTEVSVHVDATPADLWPLISDINVPGSFATELQRAEWIDDEPAVGATFRGYNKHELVGEWNVVCTVTAYEPERVFEWTVGDLANKVARWRLETEANDEGSTLRFSAEMGPGPSGLTPAIQKMPDREEDIVAGRLGEWSDNMQRTIEGIKGIAEGAERASGQHQE